MALVLVLTVACSVTHTNAGGPSSFVVSIVNQNQQIASVKFFCGGSWLGTVRQIETNQEIDARVPLHGCESFRFVLNFIATGPGWETDPIPVYPGDCWEITIGTRPQYTRWLPCAAA